MVECGQPIDDEAMNWVRVAAEVEDDAEAQCQLGDFYAYGYGVDTDLELAKVWYRKAAHHGHLEAQFNVLGARRTRR